MTYNRKINDEKIFFIVQVNGQFMTDENKSLRHISLKEMVDLVQESLKESGDTIAIWRR